MKNSREIAAQLGEALRTERSTKQLTQQELADRSGVSKSTLSKLENGGNVALEAFIRVAMTLGRTDELEALFAPRLHTVDDVIQHSRARQRRRIRKKV